MKLLLVAAAFALLTPSAASADLAFGRDETIHRLQDVAVKGANGEELFLGYKTTILFVGLGVYVSDDGYVLGVRNQSDRYYSMTADDVKAWQDAGQLPDPLPPYAVGVFDYLFGYSLWIGAAIWLVIAQWSAFRRRRAAAVPAVPAGTS